jgi:hypothetical protein
MKIAIQNGELGQAGGINTYSSRLNRYLNQLNGVEANMFLENPITEYDLILFQYEPAICPHSLIQKLLKKTTKPFIMTIHHNKGIEDLYNVINGFIFHSQNQVINNPYDYTIIPHPSLVYENLNKMKIREELGLPLDKKIIGTAGFIFGTGKNLPETVKHILKRINDDEFLYLSTSMWKAGDGGKKADILTEVKRLGKENQFRIDSDFIDDQSLNKRLQACDLLYAYCGVGPNDTGSQSGIAADMYGSRRKLIVKNSAHYSFIGNQEKVEVGREKPKEFAIDVLKTLREKDLNDVQNPEWLSWEKQIKKYYEYMARIKEMF